MISKEPWKSFSIIQTWKKKEKSTHPNILKIPKCFSWRVELLIHKRKCNSSLSSGLNAIPLTVLEDFIRPYFPAMKERTATNLSKIISFIFGIFCFGLVFLVARVTTIVDVIIHSSHFIIVLSSANHIVLQLKQLKQKVAYMIHELEYQIHLIICNRMANFKQVQFLSFKFNNTR